MPNVANMDVAGVCDRAVAYANEMLLSQSAKGIEFTKHEQIRIVAYLDSLEAYVEAVCKPENPLDLPKTHPTSHSFRDFPATEIVDAVENFPIKDVVRRLSALYTDISQAAGSKDRTSGLVAADQIRFTKLIENTRNVIEHAETIEDLPESPADVSALGK